MGFTEVLTLIFITLKLMGVITWSWWWVCSPTIIGVVGGLSLYAAFRWWLKK